MEEIYNVKKDEKYASPVIDTDEWRERILSDGKKLPFRYVHGCFEGTQLKFAFFFPEKEQYGGRFFQHVSPFPGPDEENASLDKNGADDKIAFALTHGAYFVECNMGSGAVFGSVEIYQTNAAAAEYSRTVAMEMYGCTRPYGYIYGGSGGGYKTISCIESTDVWDGAVPYVIGSPVALPACMTVRAHAMRCLRNVYTRLWDTLDAGGVNDRDTWMTEDERQAFDEATAMGLPVSTWFLTALGYVNDGALPVLAPGIKMSDPAYFEDFWKVPGYLGADPDGSAVRDRLQFRSKVKRVFIPGRTECTENEIDGRNGVDDAWQKMLQDGNKAWIELEEVPQGENLYLEGVNITFETGEAVGKKLLLGSIEGKRLMIGMCFGMDSVESVLELLKEGDTVSLDNSDYIAIQTYHRHLVPEDPSFHAWDQYRDENGKPVLPQRKEKLGRMNFISTGAKQDGNIHGKMIVVEALTDESAYPWQADWYRKKVAERTGSDDNLRLWYMDHCLHGDITALDTSRLTNYVGALHQALLDVSAWVEKGVRPLQTTAYTVENNQVKVPEHAKERRGIQPVVSVTVNGGKKAYVAEKESVSVHIEVENPDGAGAVTELVLYKSDEEKKPQVLSFERTAYGAVADLEVVYEKAGTYFVCAKASLNREGSTADIFTQVKNMDRARIVVI